VEQDLSMLHMYSVVFNRSLERVVFFHIVTTSLYVVVAEMRGVLQALDFPTHDLSSLGLATCPTTSSMASAFIITPCHRLCPRVFKHLLNQEQISFNSFAMPLSLWKLRSQNKRKSRMAKLGIVFISYYSYSHRLATYSL
jgi:hypothetical protein